MENDTSDVSRPQMYLFGCTLKSDRREFKVDVDDDDTEQQLSLKAVCLGAEAEDKFHMVEVEGLTYDGKKSKVPLVALKPSVLPSMSLGGFEITPPVTFRLQSGSGPVHISGQHFVSVKDSEDEEEENNTSPVKRPASLMSGKKPALKKLKMDSDDDEDDSDEDDDDDDEDDDSDDNDVKPQKNVGKEIKKSFEFSGKKPNKIPVKENGPAGKPSGSAVRPQTKESQQSSADFRFYIENHTRNPDDLSRKQVRIYQLYSRTTGKHVQILGKKINANGDDGGKYALLVVETETFGSHIRIKGKESEHYICMNEKGKIVGRPDGRKQECVFVEEFLENNYTALVSAKYKGWYLGFNRKGRPKKGSRTTQRQQEVHFMKRQPKGRLDPLEEFRFTTVTKRTRRARRLKPKRN
ncbi:nucleophosmin-like isoform X2 [Sparus aurata]|uniref:Nucleophosmin n=1 Tax=Sparus aurata TaxID=8175 RepID=A0A671W7A3_SPAAU|nr:nucleophosmin-like isoform X2 [Sparus aurata]